LLTNGDLIAAAEAGGFDMLITGDQNLQYQQNITGRRITIVVLATNHWPTIEANAERVLNAVNDPPDGGYRTVPFDRRPLRRRVFKGIPDLQ
jgi:hypothetical protein